MATKKAPVKGATKKPAKRTRTPWSTSEILYSVFGFLTTRPEPLILSSEHDSAPIAEILGAIVEANNLPKPGKNYPAVKVPEKVKYLSNEPPKQMKITNAEAESPVITILKVLKGFNKADQNGILKEVFREIIEDRRREFQKLQEQKEQILKEMDATDKAVIDLTNLNLK